MKKTLLLCAWYFFLVAVGFWIYYESNVWIDYSPDLADHPLVQAGVGCCLIACALGEITGNLVCALIDHLRKRRAAAPSEEVSGDE